MTDRARDPDRSGGGQAEAACPQAVDGILRKHRSARGGLIAALEDIQATCGYLPEHALRAVSDQTGRPLVDIYGIATFYRAFSLQPRGKHLVCACLGTACHVRGAPRVVEEFERQLGIRAGQTTSDRQFTLDTVNCLGACALGPVVVIDGHYFSKVKKSAVRQMLDRAARGLDRMQAEADRRAFPVDVSCPHCNRSLMDGDFAIDGRASIRVSVSCDRQHGWLRLSSLYGSTRAASQPEIPAGRLSRLFCPHCHAELAGRTTCPTCESPMVPMLVRGGGILQVCSRHGCEGRVLDLV